ncbi:MAG: hypothetical protein D6799_03005 [Bacteroidetes bacterium]|nr:MAG: hypothetical protein D6799_03005 [Bacteroidota bacterium]
MTKREDIVFAPNQKNCFNNPRYRKVIGKNKKTEENTLENTLKKNEMNKMKLSFAEKRVEENIESVYNL